MKRQGSTYFVIGIALIALLLTFVLSVASPWKSMAQISVQPTNTFTATPSTPTVTNTPVPPTATNTPVPPTATNTPVPPTATPTSEAELVIAGWRPGRRGYRFRWPYVYVWYEALIENRSAQDVYNVTATITDVPDTVAVLDSTVTVGDLAADSSAWSLDRVYLRLKVRNRSALSEGARWQIEYDDAAGVHHVIKEVHGSR